MGSGHIRREIKKIRDKSSQPKVINPKEEANKLAHHFVTRADYQTLPEEVKSALEKTTTRQTALNLSSKK